MKAIILAAGVGSRLGNTFPKSLCVLPNKEKILGRQIRIMRQYGINEICVVVGFKMNMIMEEFPDVYYKYNPCYHITNTSKSLLAGIEDLNDDILWTNGDVVFDEKAFETIINTKGNIIAVNKTKCGDEEVKYKTGNNNQIVEISKHVKAPEGEAVGINTVCKENLSMFKEALIECDRNDYFEMGIEILIKRCAIFNPVDISLFKCIEVDMEEDLKSAMDLFS